VTAARDAAEAATKEAAQQISEALERYKASDIQPEELLQVRYGLSVTSLAWSQQLMGL
jgi:hypothetical protein